MATLDRSPSLFIGQQWSAWADSISSVEENGEEEKNDGKSKLSSDSMKLGKNDMGLFGFCPARDEFSLVVCEKCSLLVKPQALKQHIESRHGPTNLSSLGNVPASALNSELGKKLLMPEPLKSTVPSVASSTATTASSHRSSNGSFRQAQFGRPPTKASLKQVPASVRTVPAPKQGFSMKINPVKSVKSGNRVATSPSAGSAPSGQPVSTPVVKVEKLQERILSTARSSEKGQEGTDSSSVATSKSELSTTSSSSSSSSSFSKFETSKISTLLSGSLKTAVSLTTPSSMTFSSLPSVSTAVSLAITKTSTDTPVNTRSLTTLVSTSTVTKPIMIAPVMTVASAMPQAPAKSSRSKLPKDQRERKFLPCKDREYDANKHCGVNVAETGKQCTRSLTCKTHALSLRRAVIGRCKSFDELLKEHKAAKDAMLKAKAESQNEANLSSNRILVSSSFIPASLANQKQPTSAGITSVSVKDGKFTHLANAIVKSSLPPSVASSASSTTAAATVAKASRGHTNVFQRFSTGALLPPAITVKEENVPKQDSTSRLPVSSAGEASSESRDPCFIPHHPRPMAMCTFGGRLSDRSCYSFSRKTDYVRAAVLSALERQLLPPPHKKLCVESNLPKEAQQPPSNSQDPYEFNQIDTSSSSCKPNIKPKSKLPTSPVAASSAPSLMAFSSASLSSPCSTSLSPISTASIALSPSLAAISPSSFSFNQPAKVPSRSSKSRDSLSNRSLDSSATSPLIVGQPNPGKRKRSGSSGAANIGTLITSVANGPLPSSTISSIASANSGGMTLSAPVELNASQLGLSPTTTLNNHQQTRNLITIPGVNLAQTLGAAPAKMASASSAAIGTVAGHKNNNFFKDLNFVLTGLDSSSLINGQVVNITPAQLAELAGNQGQTLVLNNFPVGATNNNVTTPAAQPSSSVSGVSTVAPPRPSKRHRSSGSRSHQASTLNSGKMTSNPLEGFKIIPTNNVITSGSLPPNTVLMDSSSLQGAVLTSVTLAGGGGTPTLVAITSSAGGSSNASLPANPRSQILCAEPGNTQLTHTLLSNGLLHAAHDKTSGNLGQRNLVTSSKPFLQQHNKNSQPGLALGNVIQGSPTLGGLPLSAVSASQQICSNQALFKSGGPFNLTKSVGGKVTVQPVSLTFPLNVSQQGLAGLASSKQQHPLQQQAQQQAHSHTLLVATNAGGVDDPAGAGVRKTELHLHPQISNTSTSNVIS